MRRKKVFYSSEHEHVSSGVSPFSKVVLRVLLHESIEFENFECISKIERDECSCVCRHFSIPYLLFVEILKSLQKP